MFLPVVGAVFDPYLDSCASRVQAFPACVAEAYAAVIYGVLAHVTVERRLHVEHDQEIAFLVILIPQAWHVSPIRHQ